MRRAASRAESPWNCRSPMTRRCSAERRWKRVTRSRSASASASRVTGPPVRARIWLARGTCLGPVGVGEPPHRTVPLLRAGGARRVDHHVPREGAQEPPEATVVRSLGGGQVGATDRSQINLLGQVVHLHPRPQRRAGEVGEQEPQAGVLGREPEPDVGRFARRFGRFALVAIGVSRV